MRIKELLKIGKDLLGDRENSSLDAELILSDVLGESREYLIPHGDEQVERPLEDLFVSYIKRVADGEPVAYILNEKEFYGLNFFVDNRVLVPRPETEQIIDRVFDFINLDESGKDYKILDVGTGSGNIAVSLARHDRVKEVIALDVDSGALEVARVNVDQYSLGHKIHLVESDLLEVIEEGEFFDVIVANLPYIGESKNRYVSAESERYEPHVALFGGEDGLGLYKKMFQQLSDKSVEYDLLAGEFGFAQAEIMEELLSKNFEQNWRIESDLAGIERIFIVNNGKTDVR